MAQKRMMASSALLASHRMQELGQRQKNCLHTIVSGLNATCLYAAHCVVSSTSNKPFKEWFIVPEEDFSTMLLDPPPTDRAALGWDEAAISRQLIMAWKKVGYSGEF